MQSIKSTGEAAEDENVCHLNLRKSPSCELLEAGRASAAASPQTHPLPTRFPKHLLWTASSRRRWILGFTLCHFFSYITHLEFQTRQFKNVPFSD